MPLAHGRGGGSPLVLPVDSRYFITVSSGHATLTCNKFEKDNLKTFRYAAGIRSSMTADLVSLYVLCGSESQLYMYSSTTDISYVMSIEAGSG